MQVTDAVKVLYALRKDEESVSGQVFFTLAIVVKVEKFLKDTLLIFIGIYVTKFISHLIKAFSFRDYRKSDFRR